MNMHDSYNKFVGNVKSWVKVVICHVVHQYGSERSPRMRDIGVQFPVATDVKSFKQVVTAPLQSTPSTGASVTGSRR